MIFGLLEDKNYCKVRDFAIRYCREKFNYRNIDILKRMNLSLEMISCSYRIMKDSEFYEKIFNKHLIQA